MKACLFSGPSCELDDIGEGIEPFGPAMCGSVYSALKAGFKIIGLIDGVFGYHPAVWHKEILFAIHSGAVVIGGGSIGALRAAELKKYGMISVGAIAKLYSRRIEIGDDEVALTHGPLELGCRPLTVPLINIRFTLRRMFRLGIIAKHDEKRIVRKLEDIHFSERTPEAIRSTLVDVALETTHLSMIEKYYVDAKRRDAIKVIAVVSRFAAAKEEPLMKRTAALGPDFLWGEWEEEFSRTLSLETKVLAPRLA
jgi:hypothetical protein